MKRPPTKPGYAKISATLEEPVLREIREHTDNVSAYLNEAAKRQLYFDKLRRSVEELKAQGIEPDLRFYDKLGKWMHEVDLRRHVRQQKTRSRRARG